MARQLVHPNFNVTEISGWCLRFSDKVFGLQAAYPTAWSAWTATKFKHENRDFPGGVAVPVWFDWVGDVGSGRQRYGHVAVRASDGKIWSSPLSGTGRAWFASVDDLTRAFGNGMRYVGWSEDISNVKVIELEDNMPSLVDIPTLRIVHSEMEGWPLQRTHSGEFDHQFLAAWQGTETNAFLMKKWLADGDYRQRREAALAFYDQYSQVISELSARPTKEQLQQAIDKLKAEDGIAISEAKARADKAEQEMAAAIKREETLKAQAELDAQEGASFLRRIGQLIQSLIKK